MTSFGHLFGSSRKPINRIINRDPNNQLDFRGMSIEDSRHLKLNSSTSRLAGGARRGELVRSALNYERMSRLGSSGSAIKLQKDAFAKLGK